MPKSAKALRGTRLSTGNSTWSMLRAKVTAVAFSRSFCVIKLIPALIFSYDCTDFHSRDPKKCHFKGKQYEVGKEIEDPELESSCDVGCRCVSYGDDEPAKFICAHIDCPEFFGSDYDEKKGSKCIAQYKKNGCCKERDVCGTYV